MADNIDELHRKIKDLEGEVAYLNAQLKQDNRFGLHWIDVPEAFEAGGENAIPILEEVPELSITTDDGKPTHILIEGDNYHALTCLNYTHQGKVDVIYIDPPYNTGSDGFTYKDKRFLDKYPDGAKVPSNHPLRHSSWLSFMAKRLKLAKSLLSDRGVIFISIDDNEFSKLRELCDQIFDSTNFAAVFLWKRTDTPPSLSNKVRRKLEYVLCYTSRPLPKRQFVQGYVDGDDAPLLNSGNPIGTLEFPIGSVHFNIAEGVYSASDDKKIKLLDEVVVKNGLNAKKFRASGHFKWGQNNLMNEIGNGTYCLIKSKLFSIRYQKANKSYKIPSNIIDSQVGVGTNEDAKKELRSIGLVGSFDYAKPLSLVRYLVKMGFYEDKNICVMDFFAGTGTTLQAVMQLNEEDGGTRQCILCQSNDDEDKVCSSFTYPRVSAAIKGYVAHNNLTEELCRIKLTTKNILKSEDLLSQIREIQLDNENNYESFKTLIKEDALVLEGTHKMNADVPPLGNSLKYYRTSFVGTSTANQATDHDKTILAQKAGCLLALAENTLYEMKKTDSYQIFKDKNHEVWTAIYFKEDYRPKYFNEFVHEVEQLQGVKNVYIFSWGDVGSFDSYFEYLSGVNLKSIPQPILDIYKSLNA